MERENSAAMLALIVVALRTAQQLEQRLDAPGSLSAPIAALRDAATEALEAVNQELS